jgi:hypothetical protein
MTSAIPGAPIGPDIESSHRERVYDHVPRLRELLPNGGWPGVVYAQVCVHNLKAASDRADRPANLRPIRGATYYSILGPNGEAAMALVGQGKPIPGAAPEAGERLFFTDGEVEKQTGHEVEWPIWFADAEPERTVPVQSQPLPQDLPPRPVKRKYTRHKPYQKSKHLDEARKKTQQNAHGRFVAVKEASDGTRGQQPGAQEVAGQGWEDGSEERA